MWLQRKLKAVVFLLIAINLNFNFAIESGQDEKLSTARGCRVAPSAHWLTCQHALVDQTLPGQQDGVAGQQQTFLRKDEAVAGNQVQGGHAFLL